MDYYIDDEDMNYIIYKTETYYFYDYELVPLLISLDLPYNTVILIEYGNKNFKKHYYINRIDYDDFIIKKIINVYNNNNECYQHI